MMTNPFPGTMAESDDYRVFTLTNAGDMAVTISERGGALRSWRTPDRYGRMADVLLAGRDGARGYPAPALWQGSHDGAAVAMQLTEAGGAAELRVDYRLGDDGSLVIDYRAQARLAAPLNARPCSYFNLNGGTAGVGDHMLQIDADYYVETHAGGAPAGLATVGGTPFDFRQPAPIGPRLSWPDKQISQAGGFDHCLFVRSHFAGGQGAVREVARVVDPGSGRRLQIYTTEAALRFCAGKAAADADEQMPAAPDWGRGGFCLESSAHPSLTSPAWPRVILQPGQIYRQTTVYRLSLQD